MSGLGHSTKDIRFSDLASVYIVPEVRKIRSLPQRQKQYRVFQITWKSLQSCQLPASHRTLFCNQAIESLNIAKSCNANKKNSRFGSGFRFIRDVPFGYHTQMTRLQEKSFCESLNEIWNLSCGPYPMTYWNWYTFVDAVAICFTITTKFHLIKDRRYKHVIFDRMSYGGYCTCRWQRGVNKCVRIIITAGTLATFKTQAEHIGLE